MIEERPEAVRAFVEGLYEAVAHMKANKAYTVELFVQKMEVPKDIGARVWDLDAHALVVDAAFSDKAVMNAAQRRARHGRDPGDPAARSLGGQALRARQALGGQA